MASVCSRLQTCAGNEGAAPVLAIESLPGIGPVSGAALRSRGIATVGDLLLWLPSGYDDLRRQTPIEGLVAGEVQLTCGKVAGCRSFGPRWRRGLEVRLEAQGASLRLVFFRAHKGLVERYRAADMVAVSGRVDVGPKGATMAHPRLEAAGVESLSFRGRIRPRYRAVQGVKAGALVKARRAALQEDSACVSVVPHQLAPAGGRLSLVSALRLVHDPPAELHDAELGALQARDTAAHRRVAFERVLRWVAARRMRDTEDRAREAPAVGSDGALGEALGFELTQDQRSALIEIRQDLAQRQPMRRLLHGEVGSGKTAVAFLAARDVVRAGGLVAMMAPTSLLAEALFERLQGAGVGLGLQPVLLLGNMKAAARRDVEDQLREGRANVIVGTHLLASPNVETPDITLAIIDEQQRFGVAQRLRLVHRGSAAHTPHLLAMSATPIPRTLALVLCGGLRISQLRLRPAGPIMTQTRLVAASRQTEFIDRIVTEVNGGGRAFVVCARIDQDESASVSGIEPMRGAIGSMIGDDKVAVVHGRQTPDERRRAMRDFLGGAVSVLVGSSIIEVGIDVPDVDLMVVMNAERFGLSQLHQLRGRVGRRGERAECWLVHADDPPAGVMERLGIVAASTDGFEIAEEDLRLRGAGHYLGRRQSGGPGFEGVAFHDAGPLVERAMEVLEPIFAVDPALQRPEHALLRWAAVQTGGGVLMLSPEDAG